MASEDPSVKLETTEDPPVKEEDPNIVDWEDENDPANPLNWSGFLRGLHVALVSLFTLYASVLLPCNGPYAEYI